ncbi:MAG: FAD binding domain-containing protein [Mogibacterium sp.]|nr:FAD binding domain-containing protein [Mogibacterium sp.]
MSEYLQPKSISELKEALRAMTPQSRILAGGTDLMVERRRDHPETDCILSLSHVPELRGIGLVPGAAGGTDLLRIGSMETHDRIAGNPLVRQYFPALAEACASVGSQQIRNRGTIGGNLCNATPADDTMPCVTLFGGELEILNADGQMRRLPVSELVTDFGQTCLKPEEVITAVYLPVQPGRKSSFIKLGSRKAVTIAQLSMAVFWETDGEGQVQSAEGCLGAVSLHPLPFPELGRILAGGATDPAGELADVIRGRIREIRQSRRRPPKMKITEAEQLYKERAARAVTEDLTDRIRCAGRSSDGSNG